MRMPSIRHKRITHTEKTVKKKEQVLISEVVEGGFFGEQGMLWATRAAATVQAVEYCELLHIDHKTYQEMLDKFGQHSKTGRFAFSVFISLRLKV